MSVLEMRQRVVREAREWVGTPYAEGGRVKGPQGGCDCASFIAEVLTAQGVIPREELGFYGRGFSETESGNYMLRLLRHASKTLEAIGTWTLEAQPGDIVLVRVNHRLYNHGGIVVKWPYLVHAMHPEVEEVNAANDCCGVWAHQQIAVFDPYSKQFSGATA